jgi:NADH:ubiquinone oxidoreductase subunit H
MAGVAQMVVFLVLTLYRIRRFTAMFQRDMLPLSSGWLSLVQVIVEVIGWRNSAYCIGNLHKQLTHFVLPIISASMCMKFGGPEDGGSSFL